MAATTTERMAVGTVIAARARALRQLPLAMGGCTIPTVLLLELQVLPQSTEDSQATAPIWTGMEMERLASKATCDGSFVLAVAIGTTLCVNVVFCVGPGYSFPMPNLEDARTCLARAQQRYAEFNELTSPDALWRITDGRDQQTGECFNRLHLNRERLVAAKPVLAESATNAWSALDHVAGAIARANGRTREESKHLYFPWGRTDEAFKKALAKVEPDLGGAMTEVLADARAKHWVEVRHLEAAKQISNSGKHWGFMAADGTAAAVALTVPGEGQRIFEMPADTFADASVHEYYRGPDRLPNGHHLVLVGLVVAGLEGGVPNSATTILECSFRFVQGVIDAVAGAGAVAQRA